MKYYHMIVEPKGKELATITGRAVPSVSNFNERREYISKHQGSAPRGWRCVGVCGYHETPTTHNR